MRRQLGNIGVALVSLTLGCSAGGGSGCDYPPSQGPTEPCCPDYGPDACGAGFFCAAFDGRTISTCYGNGSRLEGQTCTADEQCVWTSCNTTAGACRYQGAGCDPAIGCAPIAGMAQACDPDDTTCRRVGSGSFGELCNVDGDCDAPLVCVPGENRCGGVSSNLYARCSTDSECFSTEATPVCHVYAVDSSGTAHGYCTMHCPGTGCPAGTRCDGSPPDDDECIATCIISADCRIPELVCVDRGLGWLHCAGCLDSSECPAGRICRRDGLGGECVTP